MTLPWILSTTHCLSLAIPANANQCTTHSLRTLQEADEDGTGELDINDFVEKLGPHLGKDLTKAQITQLFMKIDADAGGTVDW